MRGLKTDDTIAAISTPIGEGGIAVLRVSGKSALDILKKVYRSKEGKERSEFESHRMFYGFIFDPLSMEMVDNVMCVYLKSPNSYTGEDTVEIYCHGGYVVPQTILQILVASGARPAEPGEFTKRAFLNGKIDLVQAEAVANVIQAQTRSGLRYAESQLRGVFSKKVDDLKDRVLDVLSEIEAYVDFPEEDIEGPVKDSLKSRIFFVVSELKKILDSYYVGRVYKNGVVTAIIGKPNVGKSSLLNRLLQSERAIVSHIAGTTRDFIEDVVDICGIPFRMIDTAGIRDVEDELEKVGIEISEKKIKEAELLLVVLDANRSLDNDDIKVAKAAKGRKAVFVLNKCDLSKVIDLSALKKCIGGNPVVEISALKETGIDELKNSMVELVTGGTSKKEASEIVLTDMRHKVLLEKCLQHLDRFSELLSLEESPEILAFELRMALNALGEITGEVATEDILGRIFSKFCVGK